MSSYSSVPSSLELFADAVMLPLWTLWTKHLYIQQHSHLVKDPTNPDNTPPTKSFYPDFSQYNLVSAFVSNENDQLEELNCDFSWYPTHLA